MPPSGETSGDELSSAAPPTVIVEDMSDVITSRFSEPHHTMREEDELLRHTSAGFADWVTTFIRRVLLLMENLPDEKVVDRSAKPTSDSDGEHCALTFCPALTEGCSGGCGCGYCSLWPDLCPFI